MLFAEFIGTFFLVAVGVASTMATCKDDATGMCEIIRTVKIAFTFGLVVATMAQVRSIHFIYDSFRLSLNENDIE